MLSGLSRVGVQATRGDVVDARGQSPADEARHRVELVNSCASAPPLRHGNLALVGGHAYFAGAFNGRRGGVAEEVEGAVLGGLPAVDGFKGTFRVVTRTGVPAEAGRIVRGDAVAQRAAEGLGTFGVEGEADLGLGGAAAVVIKVTANPAVAEVFIGLTRRVPDFHGAKVGAVGIGIAHALDDGQVALIVIGHEGLHGIVHAELVVEL